MIGDFNTIQPIRISGVRIGFLFGITYVMFWFPKTFQSVVPTGIVVRESKTFASRSHATAPSSGTGTKSFGGLKVIQAGFDILTGLPSISKEAKSPEPKLVGHIDA